MYLEDVQTEDDQPKMNRKQRKEAKRMKVAYLKSICQKPDLCEGWDVTSPDPILLMYLKAYKNTVQVPVHWSQKRRFLQNKRGVLKTPFKLPDFIEKTGISKLRDVNVNGAAMVKC